MPTIMEQLADIEERTKRLKELLDEVEGKLIEEIAQDCTDHDHADEGGDFTGPDINDRDR